jgi:hypothetical protein
LCSDFALAASGAEVDENFGWQSPLRNAYLSTIVAVSVRALKASNPQSIIVRAPRLASPRLACVDRGVSAE